MKGSKYAVLKLVDSSNFLESINQLIKDTGASITIYDNWMPKSLRYDKEAELKEFLKFNFSSKLSSNIVKWWLYKDTTTPNWDLISTCTIKGERGILLIEAKAHWDELNNESKGKNLDSNASQNSVSNHNQIGRAIEQAKTEINKKIQPLSIAISRDKCYQLSNRVAYAWWLASQGIPVVLLYLGFLDCTDMKNGERTLFTTDNDWQTCFTNHAQQVGVDEIKDKWIDCGKSKFITLCKSY